MRAEFHSEKVPMTKDDVMFHSYNLSRGGFVQNVRMQFRP